MAGQAQQAAANVQPVDVARAAKRARNAAWGTLLDSLLVRLRLAGETGD